MWPDARLAVAKDLTVSGKAMFTFESTQHGPVRLRPWSFDDSGFIAALCDDAALSPRVFAERLLQHQLFSVEVDVDGLASWDDDSLTALAIAWWQSQRAAAQKSEPVQSLASFQLAVGQTVQRRRKSAVGPLALGNPSLTQRLAMEAVRGRREHERGVLGIRPPSLPEQLAAQAVLRNSEALRAVRAQRSKAARCDSLPRTRRSN